MCGVYGRVAKGGREDGRNEGEEEGGGDTHHEHVAFSYVPTILLYV